MLTHFYQEAERRGRNQEREKRRKEKDKERERKALAAANAAVVSNPNGVKHNAPRHHRTPSTNAPSTQTAPSPRTDTQNHSRANSLYEPRRRPSQRHPYNHQHHQSQPYGNQYYQKPAPMMDGHLQAGPYGPAGGESPYNSSPGGPDQMSIHPPSTVPDPRLGPYRAPRPERAEGLQNYYEPPGWPRRPPTMTDGASVIPPPSIQPNGSPIIEPTHAPLGVVNQPSHPENLNLGHSDGSYYRRPSYTGPGRAEQAGNATEPLHTHAAGGGTPRQSYNPIIVEPGQEEARFEVQNEVGPGSALGLNGGIHRQQTPIPPGGLGAGGVSRGATPVPEISLQPPSLKGTPMPHAPHMDPSGVPLPESVYGGSNHMHGTHQTHHPHHHNHPHQHNPSMQSFADPAGVPIPHSRPGSSMYHHPHVGSVGAGLGIHRAPSVMHTPTGHARNVPLPDSVLGSPRMSDGTAYRGMPPIHETSRPPSMQGMHGMHGMPFPRSPSIRSAHMPRPGEMHPLSQAAAGEAHMGPASALPPPL